MSPQIDMNDAAAPTTMVAITTVGDNDDGDGDDDGIQCTKQISNKSNCRTKK